MKDLGFVQIFGSHFSSINLTVIFIQNIRQFFSSVNTDDFT
jgi:hypothetical protein